MQARAHSRRENADSYLSRSRLRQTPRVCARPDLRDVWVPACAGPTSECRKPPRPPGICPLIFAVHTPMRIKLLPQGLVFKAEFQLAVCPLAVYKPASAASDK